MVCFSGEIHLIFSRFYENDLVANEINIRLQFRDSGRNLSIISNNKTTVTNIIVLREIVFFRTCIL